MICDWRSVVVPIRVPLTPETSALVLDAARQQRELAGRLSNDLFGPSLVDQYGRAVCAPAVIDGGAAIVVPLSAKRLSARREA